jgi:putative membrane protein (TIGR04086 family)
MQIFVGKGEFFSQIVRGVIAAVLITLISVLTFAFILSIASISDGVIRPVNQIIKLASVFLGCFLSIRDGSLIVKGGLIGLISTLLSALLFGLIAGGVTSVAAILVDVVFGALMGIISAIVTGLVSSNN